MGTVASLLVELGANTGTFHSKMERANKASTSFGNSVGKMAKKSAAAFAAVAAAAAAGLGVMVAKSLEANDKLAKTADKLNVTTEALAGLRHAAELTGVGTDKLDTSLGQLQRRVAESAKGTGEASKALADLGLSAERLNQLSPDEQFTRIAASLEGVSNQGDKARIAYQLFGRSGQDLLNTLKLGEAGLAAVKKEAELLGLAVSRVDAAKMEAANDAMTRAGGVVKGIGNTVAAKVAPFINAMATSFTNSAVSADGFKSAVDAAFKGIVRGVGFLLDALHPVELTFQFLALGALGIGKAITDAMASSSAATGQFLTDFLTPFRVSFIGITQVIAGMAQQMADFGLATQDAANRAQQMADNLSDSLQSGLQFDGKDIQNLADGMASAVDAQSERIAALVNGPARSDQLQAWVDSVQATAQVTAEAVAASAAGGTAAIAAEMTKRSELETFQYQQTLLKDQEFFNSLWLPAKDLQEQTLLERAAQFEGQLTEVQKAQTQARIDAAKQEAQQRQAALQGMMANLQSLMSSGNKRMFEIGKKASIANTIISTIQGAQDAYTALAKIPIVGPALGIAAAGAATLAGMARVNQIKSQSFGGGSVSSVAGGSVSTSSAGASAPSIASAPTPAPDTGVGQGQQVQFVFNGPVSGNDARKLVAEMAEIINNDDVVLINPTSRNGQELAAVAA